jgi:pimeloyl-ACP methyl ester carboxylesterase
LEAGFETPGRPAVLLLHGFPEARLQLAQGDAGAGGGGVSRDRPDQRGYGRTTGWDDSFSDDPDQFRILNMVRDAVSSSMRSAAARWPPSSATTPARRWHPGAR